MDLEEGERENWEKLGKRERRQKQNERGKNEEG